MGLLGNKGAVSSSCSTVHAIRAAVPVGLWATSSWAFSSITLLLGSHLHKLGFLSNKGTVISSGSTVHVVGTAVIVDFWATSSWAFSSSTLLLGSHLHKLGLLGNKGTISSGGSTSSSVGPPMMNSFGAPSDDRYGRPLRSKGLLPAIGVGAAVYFVTGFASLGTLGLVGIGAGVGYSVGSWIADKFQKKDGLPGQQGDVSIEQLPWALQVALQQWQEFLMRRTAGRQVTEEDVAHLWAEFEQIEPAHAMNARPLVRGNTPGLTVGVGTAPVVVSRGTGTILVAPASAAAAEV